LAFVENKKNSECTLSILKPYILFVSTSGLGVWAWIAIVFTAVMLSYEHYIVNKDFTKIDKAFFTVNGYLGFVFILFIILEVT